MLLLSIISDALRAERFIQSECELIRRISWVNHVSRTLGRLPCLRIIFPTSRSLYQAYRSFAIARFGTRREKKKTDYQNLSALNGATIDALQKLNYNRMQETHVLGTAYRKTIHAEMTDHFRYVFERFAKLPQNVCVQLFVLLDAHMHETTGAPKTIRTA